MRTRDLAWLAGLIEGEGYIGFKVDQRTGLGYLRLTVGMTDEDVVRRAHEVSDIGTVHGPKVRPPHKPVWTWAVSNQSDAAGLLMTIYPMLGQRRQDKVRDVLAKWRTAPRSRARDGAWRVKRSWAKEKAPCSVEGCDRVSLSKELCSPHYQRAWYAARKAVA